MTTAGRFASLGYLRRNGITSIDLLLLTQPHGDHAAGCAPIIAAPPVRML